MRRAGCELLRCADASAVPAGHALAVDRVEFSRRIAEAIAGEPRITVHREEVTSLDPADGITVLASGPLTSAALSAEIARLTGSEHLAFYDSISPIVEADSIDQRPGVFRGAVRQGDGGLHQLPDDGGGVRPVLRCAGSGGDGGVERSGRSWRYFEGCLPIEELARRGRDTLRFGPMKPVGLRDPRTGKTPHAVVQLRCENLRADSLQPGRVSESFEVRRAGADSAADSGA